MGTYHQDQDTSLDLRVRKHMDSMTVVYELGGQHLVTSVQLFSHDTQLSRK
jgi:hypothetical protein